MVVHRTLGSGALVGLLVLVLAACDGSGGSGGFDAGGGGGAGGGGDTGDTGGAPDVGGSPDVRADAGPRVDGAGPADVPPRGDAPVDGGGPADVPSDVPGLPDLPPPADVPEPADHSAPELPGPPDVPADPDIVAADVAPPPEDRLMVDCAVPYVLDGSRVQDMGYITEHFNHLIQQYCIVGRYRGVDIASFGEKMYYGSHLPNDDVLTLTQLSLENLLTPRYSVRVDFVPDSAVVAGSVWPVGLDDGNALAVLLGHPTQQTVCLMALATGGSLTFGAANDTTLSEGGAFIVAGTLDLTPAAEVEDACEIFGASGLPCCD